MTLLASSNFILGLGNGKSAVLAGVTNSDFTGRPGGKEGIVYLNQYHIVFCPKYRRKVFVKTNKEAGEIKNQTACGKIGIDIGTQTIAISSSYDVKLLELVPEINNIDREIKLLKRKMDRSKRGSNPNKYNENGTINTKNKDKWIYSKRYNRAKNEHRELYRKQSEIRKQAHTKLANQVIKLGNEFYVETMNYKGLQAREKNYYQRENR